MRILLGLLILSFFSACGPLEKESVQPFAEVQTLADILGSGNAPTIDLTFKFEDINVKPPVRRIPVPLLGTIVSEIGNAFAEVFIQLNRDWDVRQEPLVLDLPPIDADSLKALEIKSLELKIVPGSVVRSRNPLVNLWQTITFKKANLNFLSRMTIFVANEQMYAAGEWSRIARYREKDQGTACEGKCLTFDTKLEKGERLNLSKLLARGGLIYIRPDVEVKSTPKRSFNLAGEIKIRVTLSPIF